MGDGDGGVLMMNGLGWWLSAEGHRREFGSRAWGRVLYLHSARYSPVVRRKWSVNMGNKWEWTGAQITGDEVWERCYAPVL